MKMLQTTAQTEMSFLSKKAFTPTPSEATGSKKDTWIKEIIAKSTNKKSESDEEEEKEFEWYRGKQRP